MKNAMKWILTAALVPLMLACPADPPPAPQVPKSATVKAFSVSPAQIAPGESSTLTWEVENATSVSIATLQGAAIPLADATRQQGTVEVQPEANTVYVLTARGEGGSDSAATSVVVLREEEGAPLFMAVPSEVNAGEPVTLVWNAPGAPSVTVTDGAGTQVHASAKSSGSVTVRPNADATFTLTAGEVTVEADVFVNAAVQRFTADVPAAQQGEVVTLQWTAGGATSVTLSSPGRGELFTTSEAAQIADGSFEDTVPLSLPSNGRLGYVLTATGPRNEVTAELQLYVGVNPQITELVVPGYARAGSTFPVQWQTVQADRVEILLDGRPVYVSTTAAEAANGDTQLSTPAGEAVLELRATNARGGAALQTADVVPVGAPVINDFSADVPVLAQGGMPATLSWNVTNARDVVLKEQASGKILAEAQGPAAETGSVVVYPNKLTTYVLEASNTVGDLVTPAVNVDVTTPAQLVFNPTVVPVGAPIEVTGHTVVNGGEILGLPSVQLNVPGTSFIDISTTGVDLDYGGPDTTGEAITLPVEFSTSVFGVEYTGNRVCMGNNGWLKFGMTSCSGTAYEGPYALPATELEPLAIAPLWTDLYENNSVSEMFYQLDSVNGEQRLIVQWDRFEHDDLPSTSELTVQAQIYSSGRIVFAYKTLNGLAGKPFAIGVINGDETGAAVVPITPSPGDTVTLFGVTAPPIPVIAQPTPFKVQVLIGAGPASIEVESGPTIVPSGMFEITEVHASSTVAGGQWIELTNTTSSPVDLDGYVLEVDGATQPISAGTTIPANGTVVLAQSANAGDGVNVGFVYGSGLTMVPGAKVSVNLAGANYAMLQLESTVPPPGYSLQRGTVDSGLTTSGSPTLVWCAASPRSTYGTNGQKGTPGTANTSCPGYTYQGTIPGAFEPLATTGGTLIPQSGGPNESIDTVTLPVPIHYMGYQTSTIWVSTNGFLTLVPTSCSTSTNCRSLNATSLASSYNVAGVGTVAPFWEDLNLDTGGAIYWARRTPGLAPNDGYTVVSWEKVRIDLSGTYDVNFQVKFFDNGDVEFHFGTMSGTGTTSAPNYVKGSSATTWWEVPFGGAIFEVNTSSSTSPGIMPNTGYRLAVN